MFSCYSLPSSSFVASVIWLQYYLFTFPVQPFLYFPCPQISMQSFFPSIMFFLPYFCRSILCFLSFDYTVTSSPSLSNLSLLPVQSLSILLFLLIMLFCLMNFLLYFRPSVLCFIHLQYYHLTSPAPTNLHSFFNSFSLCSFMFHVFCFAFPFSNFVFSPINSFTNSPHLSNPSWLPSSIPHISLHSFTSLKYASLCLMLSFYISTYQFRVLCQLPFPT